MYEIKDTIGTNLSLEGANPIDYYPEFQVGLTTFTARSDTSIDSNTVEGPLFYFFNSSGQANDDSLKPFWSNCKIYSKNKYMLCEKNQSTTVTQNWKNFYFNGLIFGDGSFTNVSYKNSSDDITVRGLESGDNSDTTNLDSDMKWLAFYDDSLGNAVAELFLNKSFATTNNPSMQIIDDSDFEYYLHNIIDLSSTSVSSDSMFYTRTARMIYNGLNTQNTVDETYSNLQSPLILIQSPEETSDSENPSYTITGNISYNDTANATIYSYWTDDSFLDYSVINVTGPGQNGSSTTIYYNGNHEIRNGSSLVNESYLNITLNSSILNSGTYETNIITYDISGSLNSTTINFTLLDTTPPNISNATTSPGDEAQLDPNILTQINSSITEYSTLDTILLYYKPSAQDSWNFTTMNNLTTNNYTKTFNGNFTPAEESLYSYYVFANDTSGNEANSSQQTLNITYDYTWSILSNLTTDAGVFDTNLSLGNITINNTGDYNLSFKITAGVLGSRVYINETLANTEPQFLIPNNTQAILNINATTRPSGQTEGTDTITLLVTNTSANPTSNTATVDVITITGGPFLYTTLSSSNTTVYPGDTNLEATAKVENLGNESATNVNVTLTLPTDWTTQYSLTSELGTINIGAYEEYEIFYEIPSDEDPGTYQLQATSICSENKTGTGTLAITVASQESGDGGGDEGGSGGGGGGGGGGGSGLSDEESSRFFQSTQVFEITRGQDQEFTFVLKNPYEDATLKNLNLDLEGFTEEYINYYPNHIRELPKNNERNITVQIKAPGYFTRGEYKLLFTISGQVYKNASEIIPLTYTKTLLLYLRDVSRDDAIEYKELANNYLNEMKNNNFYTKEIQNQVDQINAYFDESLFKEVKETYEQAKELYDAAIESNEGIQQIEEEVNLAIAKNIEVAETERLLSLAKTAFERGDFLSALSRINEARLTLAIESGGKYVNEALYLMKSNKKETATGALALFLFTTGTTIATRFRLVKRKLKKLNEEQSLLMDLMKAIQIEVFEKSKMSMKEYGDAMTQYEERLNKIMEERILFENKQRNIMKFKSRSKKLKEEREKLRNEMAKTQTAYVTEGKYETRVYENMLRSYSTRLSEVEEKIALMDVKRAKK